MVSFATSTKPKATSSTESGVLDELFMSFVSFFIASVQESMSNGSVSDLPNI